MPNSSLNTAKGLTLSISASVFFGALYFITPLLAPLSGEAVWALRMLFGLPVITGVLFVTKDWPLIGDTLARIRQHPWMLVGMIATSILLSLQIWVFMWAPMNGAALEVALGYFMMPLVAAVIGRTLYKDRVTWLQFAAIVLAALGVAFELFRVGQLSLWSLLVALGYPLYFVLRRKMNLNNTVGLYFDMLLTVPVAFTVVLLTVQHGPSLVGATHLIWLVPLVGVTSAVAILFYVLGAKYLSLTVFGLLSYLEPALLTVAAFLLGERIEPGEVVLYSAIWLAIGLVIFDGLRGLRYRNGASLRR